ncbi:hypothetical protein, partial [Bacillus sp. H1a]|uniref:hypothetical protein n=1 Tax=Bacillus sp. H1a TaxID=1397276 RepID=UPI001966BAEC
NLNAKSHPDASESRLKYNKTKTTPIYRKNKDIRLKSKINRFKRGFFFAFGVETGSSCGDEPPRITYLSI